MRIRFLLFIFVLLFAGCESSPERPQLQAPEDARARNLFEEGYYEQAAAEYLKLAEKYPDSYWTYRLDAANAFIMELEFERANSLLDDPDLAEAGEIHRFHRSILQARIALYQSRPERALEFLDTRIPGNVPRKLLADFYEARVQGHELQKDAHAAVIERIKLGEYLTDPDRARVNTGRIWSYFIAAGLNDLHALRSSEVEDMESWLELAVISKSLLSEKEQLEDAVKAWVESNPGHPAHPLITSQILSISGKFNRQPGRIALLLPLTGIYERYSERIRDGFLSAWFAEKSYKPVVRIYNTDSGSVREIYQRAVDDGAEFIVGPLEKDAVKILSELSAVPVRTLALNQVDSAGMDPPIRGDFSLLPDLIQYGLPPEDEARQAAQRGISEGFQRALVITSADEYGDRVFNAFGSEWKSLGGRVLERVNYDPQTTDFITPVKQLLNIDASEDRISRLRQRLGRNVSITSRLRQDADFVFMVASNLTARQIVPHLRFFRAGSLPIYTISYVYTGRPNPQVDSDLNGVEFVDMPWILRPENEGSALHAQIQQSWQAASTVFPRYYAFGIDAFRLISRIGDLSLNEAYSYPGETGELYMTGSGVIQRNLSWAKFVNGVPRRIQTETGR